MKFNKHNIKGCLRFDGGKKILLIEFVVNNNMTLEYARNHLCIRKWNDFFGNSFIFKHDRKIYKNGEEV